MWYNVHSLCTTMRHAMNINNVSTHFYLHLQCIMYNMYSTCTLYNYLPCTHTVSSRSGSHQKAYFYRQYLLRSYASILFYTGYMHNNLWQLCACLKVEFTPHRSRVAFHISRQEQSLSYDHQQERYNHLKDIQHHYCYFLSQGRPSSFRHILRARAISFFRRRRGIF